MPTKRRRAKRRLDPAAERAAWVGILAAGYDYFDALVAMGVAVDQYGRPDREAALTAWKRFGPAIMAEPMESTPWALEEFGEP